MLKILMPLAYFFTTQHKGIGIYYYIGIYYNAYHNLKFKMK